MMGAFNRLCGGRGADQSRSIALGKRSGLCSCHESKRQNILCRVYIFYLIGNVSSIPTKALEMLAYCCGGRLAFE